MVDPAGDPQARSWYERRQRAMALAAERELAHLEGRLLDVDVVAMALAKQVGAMKQHLLAIPSKAAAASPPAARAAVASIVETLIHEALQEISGSDDGNLG